MENFASAIGGETPAIAAEKPAPTGDGLKDLLALEAENERLKKMLADWLRKENAELKKKLGLE
ncbi:hypothetical protein KYK29_07120 [Shinella daejeonensis]|nr:hypothetical protein [Shinella daejeonensis]